MISAIILAAGQSKRMGKPKMLLRWGKVTVIEHVISVFSAAGIEDILVVTGAERERLEEIIENCKHRYPVRAIFNDAYLHGEMLSSIQCGLRSLITRPPPPLRDTSPKFGEFGEGWEGVAALIGLGDQPQVEERSVRTVCEAFQRTESPLVVPSFQMRRGHPWLAARSVWEEILSLKPEQTPRDFLNSHADTIHYVNVDTPAILADLDTPEAYEAARPK